jgi:hypothetical protein
MWGLLLLVEAIFKGWAGLSLHAVIIIIIIIINVVVLFLFSDEQGQAGW